MTVLIAFSALMPLVGWQDRHLACKNWVVECFSEVRCRLAYSPADATAIHCLLLQIGFTFLVLAHPGSPVEHTHTTHNRLMAFDHQTSFVNFLHLRSMASSLFSLRACQSSRTTSPGPLWSACTLNSIHFFTQPSSFRSTCPYQRSLFYCNTNAVIQSLSTYLSNQDKGLLNRC